MIGSEKEASRQKHQVLVPREYFEKSAKNDYQNTAVALLREILQNCRDAGSSHVELRIEESERHPGQVRLYCQDDGCGMSRETILDKLMCLGGTTKDGSADNKDSVGGFGIAKILLFLSQTDYEIRTRNLVLRGVGGDFRLDEVQGPSVTGVSLDVTLNPSVISHSPVALSNIFENEIAKSFLPRMQICLNGNVIDARKKAGRVCHQFNNDVRLYKKRLPAGETTHSVAVRVAGLHMFEVYLAECRYELTVELKGYSTDYLTANRDGFRRDWSTKVHDYVQRLNMDSNFGEKTTTHYYVGKASRVSPLAGLEKKLTEWTLGGDEERDNAELTAMIKEAIPPSIREQSDVIDPLLADAGSLLSEAKERQDKNQQLEFLINRINQLFDGQGVDLNHNYYIETKGRFRGVPSKWRPENFNKSQNRLLELWAEIIGMVLSDAGAENLVFDVGFILDDGSEGEDVCLAKHRRFHVRNVASGKESVKDVFLLNPLTYGTENRLPLTKKRSVELCMWLLNLAVHEVTHQQGHLWHNEAFIMAEVQLKRKTLLRINDYLQLTKKY